MDAEKKNPDGLIFHSKGIEIRSIMKSFALRLIAPYNEPRLHLCNISFWYFFYFKLTGIQNMRYKEEEIMFKDCTKCHKVPPFINSQGGEQIFCQIPPSSFGRKVLISPSLMYIPHG